MSEIKAPPGPLVEFFCYERSGQGDEDIGELVDKLMSDDDVLRYYGSQGSAVKWPSSRGYTVLEVLPQLKGMPFNNLALAYIVTLHPSKIRATYDAVTCDACADRVTVYLTEDKKIEKIHQEVAIGYGTGHDVGLIFDAVKAGRTPPRTSYNGPIGNTAGLERVDFK